MMVRHRSQPALTAMPARQRGAALVIAAVFLVAVMVVLGDVTLRLSATDVTDSALQADAVDALFLTETGMEYAAQRLGNGTACTGLVMGSAVSFGRGDFQVTQATDVSGDCRIRVIGRVLFGGSDLRAQRTVEGLLSVGGVGAITVGNNGTILHWDGSNWSSVASGTTGNFTGIDCTDASNCIAVASNNDYSLWNGNNWSTTDSGSLVFTGVSCRTDIDDCHASGGASFFFWYYGLAAQWGGSSWSVNYTRFLDLYTTISCTNNTCHAASENGNMIRLTSNWAPDGSLGSRINGISCPADDDCWAVGNAINSGSNRGYAIFGRNSGGWFNDSLNVNPRRDLYAVDCIAINDCWAVGERRNGNTYTVLRRNGGSWALNNQGLGSAENLNGIDCNDNGRCLAVGDSGRVLHYDGGSWTATTETTETLNDVHYMDGSGGGGVSLVRWWEIIN